MHQRDPPAAAPTGNAGACGRDAQGELGVFELRRVALGRKNWLFVGSEDAGKRTATILTVISSAHRHDLDVWAYLRDALERLARGTSDLGALLPDVWKAAHPEHVRTFREQEKENRAAARRYRRARRRQSRPQ